MHMLRAAVPRPSCMCQEQKVYLLGKGDYAYVKNHQRLFTSPDFLLEQLGFLCCPDSRISHNFCKYVSSDHHGTNQELSVDLKLQHSDPQNSYEIIKLTARSGQSKPALQPPRASVLGHEKAFFSFKATKHLNL